MNFLLDHPTRATDIAVLATNVQDQSIKRVYAAPPPPETEQPAPPAKQAPASGQKRRCTQTLSEAPTDPALLGEDESQSQAKAKNYSLADVQNQLVIKFPASTGGSLSMKLGAATTISAIII